MIGNSNIHAFIQAGGRSSRMGTDKAWLEINGRPMIEHVLAAAQPVAASLSIVINHVNPNAERYRELATKWNARLLFDLHDHKGPLGGIHTALKNCEENESALILACDMPFLTTEFLSFLCHVHQVGNMQFITVPSDQEGRLQPLAAIYERACLPATEELLATDRLKLDWLFDQVPARKVSFESVFGLTDSKLLFQNMNSNRELQLAVTKTQEAKLLFALEQFDDSPAAHPGVHPKLIQGQRDAIASQLETLRQEIEQLERELKADQTA